MAQHAVRPLLPSVSLPATLGEILRRLGRVLTILAVNAACDRLQTALVVVPILECDAVERRLPVDEGQPAVDANNCLDCSAPPRHRIDFAQDRIEAVFVDDDQEGCELFVRRVLRQAIGAHGRLKCLWLHREALGNRQHERSTWLDRNDGVHDAILSSTILQPGAGWPSRAACWQSLSTAARTVSCSAK